MTKTSLRELCALALPSSLFVLLTNSYRIVDQYWVDRISVAAQAAVGATMFVLVVAFASFEMLSAGRATGGEDPVTRRTVLGEAIFSGFLLASLWTLIATFFAGSISASLGLDEIAQAEAKVYLHVLGLTCLPLVLTPLSTRLSPAREWA